MGKDLMSECMRIRRSFVQFLDGGKGALCIFPSAHPGQIGRSLFRKQNGWESSGTSLCTAKHYLRRVPQASMHKVIVLKEDCMNTSSVQFFGFKPV